MTDPTRGQSVLNLKKLRRVVSSIRFRLTGWYVVVLGLVLGLFGVVVYVVLSSSLHSGLDDLLRSRSEQLVAGYNINDGQINLQEQDESGPALPVEGEIWLLLDRQGKLIQREGHVSDADANRLISLANAPKTSQSQEAYQSFKIASTGNATSSKILDYRFYFVSVIESGQSVGLLVLGRSRETVEETLHRLLLVLLFAAPVALLLSAAGGYWLAARAMRPVRTITQAANEIEESDLSRRLNLKGPQDELAELAGTFDRMLGRLDEAFKRQRQFTADASHELRTPLTIIDLEVNRALNRLRKPEEYRQALEIIQSENNYMSRVVNDLLTLARADAGQTNLEFEELELSDLTLEVVERLIPLARQKELNLVVGELPELPILGNRVYLTQMISNLVENAIKYTAGTGSWVRVNTGIEQGQWAYLRVADNGPGIEATHQPQLFDRFYRIDQARTRLENEAGEVSSGSGEGVSGSGLGLSIVKWVAKSHDGEVRVESQVGKGTLFEVWLPLTKEQIVPTSVEFEGQTKI